MGPDQTQYQEWVCRWRLAANYCSHRCHKLSVTSYVQCFGCMLLKQRRDITNTQYAYFLLRFRRWWHLIFIPSKNSSPFRSSCCDLHIGSIFLALRAIRAEMRKRTRQHELRRALANYRLQFASLQRDFMSDLWSMKWLWGRLFSGFLPFPPVYLYSTIASCSSITAFWGVRYASAGRI
jgi:hypothetical protein